MSKSFDEQALENIGQYLTSTGCKEWRRLEDPVIEWYRSHYHARVTLEEGTLDDFDSPVCIRTSMDDRHENAIWYVCFEIFPGIIAERHYRRQTAQYCASLHVDPCAVQEDFDFGNIVIKAAFPMVENPITHDTLHLIEHIASQLIEAEGDSIDSLARGNYPFSAGKNAVIPFNAKPVSPVIFERTASVVRRFLEDYHAHEFVIESRSHGLPSWKSIVEIGSEKAVSRISISEIGLLKMEFHLDHNSHPLPKLMRGFAAEVFQKETDDRWPAFAWIGSDDEPPMVYAFASLLDGEISEETLIEVENAVAMGFKEIIDVAGPISKGFYPDRRMRYYPPLHLQDQLDRLNRLEELYSRTMLKPFEEPEIVAPGVLQRLHEATQENHESETDLSDDSQ